MAPGSVPAVLQKVFEMSVGTLDRVLLNVYNRRKWPGAAIRTKDKGNRISVDKADFLVTFCGLVRMRLCKH